MQIRELSSTYRLQFNKHFTFNDAIKIIPYLHMLGVSHIYSSPFLKARKDSPHGYDIVDHNQINPEIGSYEDYKNFINSLHQHQMGLILDIVPNHMGVGGDDNAWWLDVLENGPSSVYSDYFDIDWRPANVKLWNKVLLPFLGDHYGKTLLKGELALEFNDETGSFSIRHYHHRFPIDPKTYPLILTIDSLISYLNNGTNPIQHALIELINLCESIPERTEIDDDSRQKRKALCEQVKANLASLKSGFLSYVNHRIQCINGTPGADDSYDTLHQLLDAQAYRLTYWQVASDEINYRRFFNVNELSGLRMENENVFDDTHQFLRDHIRENNINGLRIDHPDGLYDPYRYLLSLKKIYTYKNDMGTVFHFPVFIEKILGNHETLPRDWPVSGTTGYEVGALLNGLYVYPRHEGRLTQLYQRFTGIDDSFDDILYRSKLYIAEHILASELTVLTNLLYYIAQSDRDTRDFTYLSLREAIAQLAACFPIYRTYITLDNISEQDLHYIKWSIKKAKKRAIRSDHSVYDFISDVMLFRLQNQQESDVREKDIKFTMRFQQFSAPVMAKGMEDTSFYLYNRLLSLNDVGFNPRLYGTSVSDFHKSNQSRHTQWPHCMVSTSTHDSKRSEDVRSRINVISEMTGEWRLHLSRWSRVNRSKTRKSDTESRSPTRNDEYFIYQTLLGSWPLEFKSDELMINYKDRIQAYILKSIREAKAETSWEYSNNEYEDAVKTFIDGILDPHPHNPFIADFDPFVKKVARFGLLNSLSQALLKLTIPGVPDIYQGMEVFSYNLVDPDNRRPVDYKAMHATLTQVSSNEAHENKRSYLKELILHIENGQAKMYLTYKMLRLRSQYPDLFLNGEYISLKMTGKYSDHLIAFARKYLDKIIIVVAARWFYKSLKGDYSSLSNNNLLHDVSITIHDISDLGFTNYFSGIHVKLERDKKHTILRAGEVLSDFPVAVLLNQQILPAISSN